jgi:mutator protein MutT
VTRRLKGTHLEGVWEFPGGKCEPGESLGECLARELAEELGIHAVVGREVFATSHAYEDRTIELHFMACTSDEDPTPLLGQEMRWVTRAELAGLEFPPADAELIQRLVRFPSLSGVACNAPTTPTDTDTRTD